jgi:hypothetical protein
MSAAMSLNVIAMLLLNLTGIGPAELHRGDRWEYRAMGNRLVMTVVEVRPEAEGTFVRLEVSSRERRGEFSVGVALSEDRSSMQARVAGSGDEGGEFELHWAGPKVGAELRLPDGDVATVTAVEPSPTMTPNGHFPEAIRAKLAVPGDTRDVAIVMAQGTGVLAVEEGSRREFELVYSSVMERPRPARPDRRDGHPDAPGTRRPGERGVEHTPVVTALDKDTFVVADPATRTVTLFHIDRSAGDAIKLVRVGMKRYGPTARQRPRPPEHPRLGGSRPPEGGHPRPPEHPR